MRIRQCTQCESKKLVNKEGLCLSCSGEKVKVIFANQGMSNKDAVESGFKNALSRSPGIESVPPTTSDYTARVEGKPKAVVARDSDFEYHTLIDYKEYNSVRLQKRITKAFLDIFAEIRSDFK